LIWFFFIRNLQGGGGRAMSFGKSRIKAAKNNKTTFKDVAGIDEAKQEVKEIVDFLKNPEKFTTIGAKIPKGCLLVGPPGTGKTMLAKAIAGEANVPFFSVSGSDFVEMFVGVGASRVRDMFEQGKKNAPCIIFIDEIDSLGRTRGGGGVGGGFDEREQTLNQLLVEMDGFEANESVILMAATNRPDVLDKALLRPGRFDRQIAISLPDIKGRSEILNVHINNVKHHKGIDLDCIARSTTGFSGADLANLINEAALMAARENKLLVTTDDFEKARDRILMGSERKTFKMRDEELRLTAYHEAGHALVSVKLPSCDPIHKATIIPRGRSLGLVMRIPEYDQVSHTKEKMLSDLAVAMGGRAAEEIIFGDNYITSGATSDIQQATKLAKAMVMSMGMSQSVGPILVDDETNRFISHDLANSVDQEISLLVKNSYNIAVKTINENIKQLHDIAKHLLKHETLTGTEINQILEGKFMENNKSDSSNITVNESKANSDDNKKSHGSIILDNA
ncbi:MAG: ATP-dependent zinc metalloprotease FtsH, partial [Anaplasmataceae bacterium]|nr:ATP-dependent zinc metalloprotease FtsH [Anaplasmataceae bacterium]